MLDRELDREVLLGFLGSNVCASASGLVCALGVADQSLVIGAIEVCRGGGELGLLENFCKHITIGSHARAMQDLPCPLHCLPEAVQ